MIGWIAGLLVARNPALTLAHARRLAWIVAILGALFVAAAGIGIWLTLHDRAVIERHETRRQLEELQHARKADDAVSRQRAADTIRNHDMEKARTDAIRSNPDDPRLGLNCARLRAAGIDAPPACAGR